MMLPPLCYIPVAPRRCLTQRCVCASVVHGLSINGPHATTTRLRHWKTTPSPMFPATRTTPIVPPTTPQFTPTTVLYPCAPDDLAALLHDNRAHAPPPAPCDRPSRHEFFAPAVPYFNPHAESQCLPQFQPRQCYHLSLRWLQHLYLRLSPQLIPSKSHPHLPKCLPYSNL
jgi:hypothetical protein